MCAQTERAWNDRELKMKRILFAAAAAAALATAMPAAAADLGGRYGAPAYAPPQIYNWTGFYQIGRAHV